MYTPTCTSTG